MAFEYVSIPSEIAATRHLSWTDKAVLGFMVGFKGKFRASNRYIAECLGMGEKTVEAALTRLRKGGYVKGRTPTNRGGQPLRIKEQTPTNQGGEPLRIKDIYYRDNKDDNKDDNKGVSLSVVVEKKENDEVVAAPPKPAGCPLAARESNKALALRAIRRARRNSALERRESLA